MRALVLPAVGAPLELVERPQPEPRPGWLVVAVEACGVCHRDLLDRRGAFPFIQTPIVPGHEIAGRVLALGEGVEGFAVGQRVVALHRNACGRCRACRAGETTRCEAGWEAFGLTIDGGYATHVAGPANAWVPAPEAWDAAEAAVTMCTFGTVWRGLRRLGLRPGERVLVTGASGGLGTAAVTLLSRLGCSVVATTRSETKAAWLHELGASEVLVGTPASWRTAGTLAQKPPTVVVETVGAPAFAAALRVLAPGGRLLALGNVDLEPVPLKLGRLIVRDLTVLGSDGCTPTELTELFAWMTRTGVRPRIAARWPLTAAEEAQARLAAGEVGGRQVLVP